MINGLVKVPFFSFNKLYFTKKFWDKSFLSLMYQKAPSMLLHHSCEDPMYKGMTGRQTLPWATPGSSSYYYQYESLLNYLCSLEHWLQGCPAPLSSVQSRSCMHLCGPKATLHFLPTLLHAAQKLASWHSGSVINCFQSRALMTVMILGRLGKWVHILNHSAQVIHRTNLVNTQGYSNNAL